MKIKYPYTKPQSPTPFNSNSHPSHFCTKLVSKTKVQGQSLDDVKVSFQDARFTAGQSYVALSRAKSMSGLHLSSFFPEKIKVNKLALLEMERLNSSRILSWKSLISEHRSASNVIFLHLNIRSFRAHKLDLCADEAVLSADLVALTETHVKAVDVEQHTSVVKNTKHGIALIAKQSFKLTHRPELELSNSIIESLAVEVEHHDKTVTVLVCYIPPQTSAQQITRTFSTQLQLLPPSPCVIFGDFNMDLKKMPPVRCLEEAGFQQHITDVTHREGSLLDHMYTKNLDVDASGTVHCYYSDHCTSPPECD